MRKRQLLVSRSRILTRTWSNQRAVSSQRITLNRPVWRRGTITSMLVLSSSWVCRPFSTSSWTQRRHSKLSRNQSSIKHRSRKSSWASWDKARVLETLIFIVRESICTPYEPYHLIAHFTPSAGKTSLITWVLLIKSFCLLGIPKARIWSWSTNLPTTSTICS